MLPEADTARSTAVFHAKPSRRRATVSASLYLFLCYLGYGMSFTPLAELFVQRSCADIGVDLEHCKPTINGKHYQPYDDAQKKAASASVLYQLLLGLPQVVLCSTYGVLGDAHGRRFPLLIPLIGQTAQGFSLAIAPTNIIAMAVNAVFSILGGIYVCNVAAFSSLADATQGLSAKERASVFGTVEGFLWVGLLVGPIVGGEMSSILGSQHAFFAAGFVGLVNIAITFFTFKETLEESRRCPFSWHRANPLSSLGMFSQTKSTFLFGIMLLLGLTAQTGGTSMLSLYALKVGKLSDLLLGMLQSTLLGSSVIGLMIVMPVLARVFSLQKLLLFSFLDASIAWLLMAFVYCKWQLFAAAAGLFFAGCFFPVVRTGMANTFGKDRYGESLAAVGVVEQICDMIGAPIVNSIYNGTESIEFGVGGLTVRSIACLSVAGMYMIAMVATFVVTDIPKEGAVGCSVRESLTSDC